MKPRFLKSLTVPLGLAAALWLAPGSLRAQAHQAPEAAQAEGAAPAHEGAEHEGGHHAEVKLFGKSLGRGAQFGVQVFNFAIFAGLLVFLLKGALSSAFKARARELEEKLSQSERDRLEGEAQLRELEGRMAGLQGELEGIMARADADAEAEKQRILEAATAEAAQILAQAQSEIEFQKLQAEKELRSLVAELAAEGAARRLQAEVQGPVASRVMDHAIEHLGGVQ